LACEGGTRSGAGFPLLNKGSEAVGVLLFLASEEDVFTADLVELLAKLAENVSFALDNFDRADEKTKADERIEYLASHDSLTNLPIERCSTGCLTTRSSAHAATCGDLRCCSSISTGSRSSTIRLVTTPAISC
jgi:transcriptional regulator with GAF, ATPase, and Fis domain